MDRRRFLKSASGMFVASAVGDSLVVRSRAAAARAGIVFHSDWRTGTGTTDAARRDTRNATPWRNYAGNRPSGIETAASLGLVNWPTPNAYVVRTGQAQMGTMWSQLDCDLGTPAPGNHRYFRVYVAMLWQDRHGDGNGLANGEHGIEGVDRGYNEGGGGGDGFNPMMLARANGTWNAAYREISNGYRYVAPNISFAKFATYRMEWHLAYGIGVVRVEMRIYDGAGKLIASTPDFRRVLPYPQGESLSDAVIPLATPVGHRWFRVGSNGPTTNYPGENVDVGDAFRAHGAVAVSSTDWCGPYRNGI